MPLISKQEFDKFMKMKGEARGSSIKGEAEFVLKEQGEQGLKKLEDTITELGYPIKYKKMQTMDFYPIGLEALTLLGIKRLFNYDDKKFQQMGRFESKLSFIIRLFTRYFFSVEQVVKQAPKMWRENYTVGKLKVVEFNEEKKYAIVRIENFKLIPILCENLKGFFPSILKMVVGKPVTAKETKCSHRGDEYHEFVLKW